jgi:hypothetical protein
MASSSTRHQLVTTSGDVSVGLRKVGFDEGFVPVSDVGLDVDGFGDTLAVGCTDDGLHVGALDILLNCQHPKTPFQSNPPR